MRIVGGELRGRRFRAGRDYSIRPTSDKVREAIGDILQGRIEGRNVLDLFAGTGALGIEALSRGARAAIFADSSRVAIKLIRDNLESLNLSERGNALLLKIPEQLKRLCPVGALREAPLPPAACGLQPGVGYDLIFMDPPYGKELIADTLSELNRLDLAAPGAILVVEHSARESISDAFGSIQLTNRRVYSTTAVSFYERVI